MYDNTGEIPLYDIYISYGKLDSKTYYSKPSRTEIVFYSACPEG